MCTIGLDGGNQTHTFAQLSFLHDYTSGCKVGACTYAEGSAARNDHMCALWARHARIRLDIVHVCDMQYSRHACLAVYCSIMQTQHVLVQCCKESVYPADVAQEPEH